MKSATSKKTIMLVDGHPVVREKLKEVLNATRDLTVCGEAETAFEAVELFPILRPDVAIVNISLDGSVGLEAIQTLRRKCPALPVFASVLHDEQLLEEEARKLGAQGCISIRNVIRSVRSAIAA
jgi:DNA-binding NarL/FixJ family response regulator